LKSGTPDATDGKLGSHADIASPGEVKGLMSAARITCKPGAMGLERRRYPHRDDSSLPA